MFILNFEDMTESSHKHKKNGLTTEGSLCELVYVEKIGVCVMSTLIVSMIQWYSGYVGISFYPLLALPHLGAVGGGKIEITQAHLLNFGLG